MAGVVYPQPAISVFSSFFKPVERGEKSLFESQLSLAVDSEYQSFPIGVRAISKGRGWKRESAAIH
jgi:hypothetical protein